MSYILDALKKVDHEKNKKRSDGRLNISGDLFHERPRPVMRIGLWKIILLLISVSLVVCGTTLLVMRVNAGKVVQPLILPTPAPVSMPALPVPVTSTVSQERAESLIDAISEISINKKRITPKVSSQKQFVQTVTAPADIKLSGIAWQEERADRRAVINGFLLKEGGVVSGAKITDIEADKVYFSSSTGVFQIKLDAALPVEVKR